MHRECACDWLEVKHSHCRECEAETKQARGTLQWSDLKMSWQIFTPNITSGCCCWSNVALQRLNIASNNETQNWLFLFQKVKTVGWELKLRTRKKNSQRPLLLCSLKDAQHKPEQDHSSQLYCVYHVNIDKFPSRHILTYIKTHCYVM